MKFCRRKLSVAFNQLFLTIGFGWLSHPQHAGRMEHRSPWQPDWISQDILKFWRVPGSSLVFCFFTTKGAHWGRLLGHSFPLQGREEVRQKRQAPLQRRGPVRLSGEELPGLLLPLPQVQLQQVRAGVPLQPQLGLRCHRHRDRGGHQRAAVWHSRLGRSPAGWSVSSCLLKVKPASVSWVNFRTRGNTV